MTLKAIRPEELIFSASKHVTRISSPALAHRKLMLHKPRYPKLRSPLRLAGHGLMRLLGCCLPLLAVWVALPASVAHCAAPVANWVAASDEPDADQQDPPHEEDADLVSFLQQQPLSVNPTAPADGSGRRSPSTPNNPRTGSSRFNLGSVASNVGGRARSTSHDAAHDR